MIQNTLCYETIRVTWQMLRYCLTKPVQRDKSRGNRIKEGQKQINNGWYIFNQPKNLTPFETVSLPRYNPSVHIMKLPKVIKYKMEIRQKNITF